MLLNYHIGRLVLSSLCVGAFVVAGIWWCSFCRLKHNKLITYVFNSLNAELNSICHLLALLGAHHIFHVSRISVNISVRRLRAIST